MESSEDPWGCCDGDQRRRWQGPGAASGPVTCATPVHRQGGSTSRSQSPGAPGSGGVLDGWSEGPGGKLLGAERPVTPGREGSLGQAAASRRRRDSRRGSPVLVPDLLLSSLLSLRIQGGMETAGRRRLLSSRPRSPPAGRRASDRLNLQTRDCGEIGPHAGGQWALP